MIRLDWKPRVLTETADDYRRFRSVRVSVADAPEAGYYAIWRERDYGWCVTWLESLEPLYYLHAKHSHLGTRGDAELVASGWANGIDTSSILGQHEAVEVDDAEESGIWTAWWRCRCGAEQQELGNLAEAAAGHRGHVRVILRSAVEAIE